MPIQKLTELDIIFTVREVYPAQRGVHFDVRMEQNGRVIPGTAAEDLSCMISTEDKLLLCEDSVVLRRLLGDIAPEVREGYDSGMRAMVERGSPGSILKMNLQMHHVPEELLN